MARFDIISKDGKTIRYSGKPRYCGSYLKPSFLEFSEIAYPTPIAWEVGDYVDYPRTGMRYRLYSIPQASKNARKGSYGGAFAYSNVQFHAATKELEIALFRDLVANDNNIHFSTSPDVATYENVEGIARRIQACMDDLYPGRWEIRIAEFDAVADAEVIEKIATAKNFALSGGTCLDALSKIYELWEDIGWIHTYENGKEVITIGYANRRIDANTTDAYLYGKGNGLTAIKKNQTNKDEFATRLYVYGSERNLPHRYYNGKDILNAESVDIRNLMLPLDKWGLTDGLPDARKAYLENAEAVAKYGVIPKIHYFDSDDAGADIYPSIEGMTVGQLRKVLADMGETKYSPDASIYPDDSERVDEVWGSPKMVDDGVLKRSGKEHDIEYGQYIFAVTTPKTTIPKGTAEKTAVVENLIIKDIELDAQGIVRAKITFTSEKTCTIADAGYESVSGVLTLANSLDSPSIKEEVGFTFVLNEEGVWEGRLPKVVANYDKLSYMKYVAFASMSVYVTPKQALASDITASVNISDGYVTFIADQLFDKTFRLTLKQIGFDINERAAIGEGKVISMKTGMCAGRNFVISECRYVANVDRWVLICRRQQDDTLGMLFPNKDYQIATDDQFVLLDIALPEVYIGVAQERLLAEGERLLAKASRIQSHYEPMIDAKVMIESGRTLREGMFMEISDEDVIDNGTDYILIDTLSIYEDESAIPTYKVTLREKRKVTYKGTPSATSETSTKSYGEDQTVNADIDLSDYATKDYVDDALKNFTPGDSSVDIEGSEFVKVTDGKVSLELDSQGGLGNAGQGLGIVELPSELLKDYAKKSDLDDIFIEVDTEMSDTSDNAVANRVIKAYVDAVKAELDAIIGGDATDAIESINEILAFLSTMADTETLAGIVSNLEKMISDVEENGAKYTNEAIASLRAYVDSADDEIKKRLATLEEGGDVDHPVFEFTFDSATNKATTEMVAALAEAIAADKLILCNGRTYKFILEQDGMYGLVSDAYMDIMDGKLKASVLAVVASTYDVQLMEQEVPVGTEITEATIRNWGFTKNAGTITGIKMNGATKGTSGVVDLGNVLTEHQKLKTINGESIVGEGNITIQGGGATPRVEMTAASAAIEPNKFYVWPMMDSLDVSLGAEQTGVMNRYLFQFRNPKAGLTILTLPDTITWSEDTELDENGLPVMEAAAFYRIEIIEGLASLKKWKLVYINFADAEVERVLMSKGIGDGIGITKKDAKSVTTIGTWFKGNALITSFDEFQFFTKVTTLDGNISNVNSGAFSNCVNLTRMALPTSITTIKENALYGCSNLVLADVNLPNLITLGQNALYGVKVTKISSLGKVSALPNASTSTQNYGSKNTLEEVVLPNGITAVPNYSFRDYVALRSVVFSPNITSVGQQSFAQCPLLAIDLGTLPVSLVTIDQLAFNSSPCYGCINLPNLKGTLLWGNYNAMETKKVGSIENIGSVTNVGGFMRQEIMTYAKLPATCTTIQASAFANCTSLQFIICYAITPPSCGSGAFNSTNNCPIYVPDASVEAYKAAMNWNTYADRIKGISEYIGTI